MNELWNRLVTAIQQTHPEFSVEGIAGVTPESWEPFERQLGHPLPDSFKAFYAVHDGLKGMPQVGFLWCDWELLPQESVIGRWEAWHDIVEEHSLEELQEDFDDCISRPPGAVKEQYACEGWVSFGDDHSSNSIGIDLTPDSAGMTGQVITFGRDTPTKYVLANNFTDFLEWFIAQIEAGHIVAEIEDETLNLVFTERENWPDGYTEGAPLAQACHKDMGFADS